MNISLQQKWGDLAPSGLPQSVEFCSKCTISNQKPITQLESQHTKNHLKKTTNFYQGVCDACRWAEVKQTIDWSIRNNELIELCDKHRSSDGSFDVVVPSSGGKDSRYVAHVLKHTYGMHPLTVTWKPHIYTEIGFKNLVSLINNGFANHLISPNGDVQRRLCQLAFKNLGHPFQPFIAGQRVVGPKVAMEKNIKLVFYGENVAEYGNRIDDNYIPTMDPKLYTCFDFNSNNLSEYSLAGIPLESLIKDHGFSYSDLLFYQSPALHDIELKEIETHYMSYYRKWIPQENYYYAVKNTDFEINDRRRDGSFTRYSGLDDMLEDLHYYMQFIKFGMGRCTWDTAQEIRTGHLERDEGVDLVSKYDSEPPMQFFNEILNYLQINQDEFWEIINMFRPKHLWNLDRNTGNFSLKNNLV